MKYTNLKLIIATLMVTTVTGCAGSKLRNMISRSDYMTVEELEAQDSLTAEREEAAREKALAAADRELASGDSAETLVSQTRALTAGEPAADNATETNLKVKADAETTEPARKGFFNIAGLFKRSKAKDEVTPDPFVEVEESQEETEAVAANGPVIEPNQTAKTQETEEKASLFSETMAAVEKEAESVFEETQGAIFEAPISENTETPVVAAITPEEPSSSSQSFSDFMAARQKTASTRVTEEAAPIQTVMAEAQQAEASAESDFDTILSGGPIKQPALEFASELFPDLADTEVTVTPLVKESESATASVFDEVEADFASLERQPALSDDQTQPDSFAEASEKHGFNKLTQRDPWAAFDSVNPAELSQTSQADSGSFAWSLPEPRETKPVDDVPFPELPASEPLTFEDVIASDESVASASATSPFTQISQSQSIPNTEVTVDEPLLGLVIPEAASPTAENVVSATNPFEPQFEETVVSQDTSANDPFAEQFFEEAAGSEEPTESITASSAPLGVRWSIRSWFLLLGCLLVIALLVLPDRHNRKNS